MIQRPSHLREWTLDLVREIAASAITENEWFDFKAELQPAEHQRKVVAAFANTQGGFMVFGVKNDRTVVGTTNRELPRDFGNRLTSGLNPSVAFQFGRPLEVAPGAMVWVCEVPRSPRGPHGVKHNDLW